MQIGMEHLAAIGAVLAGVITWQNRKIEAATKKTNDELEECKKDRRNLYNVLYDLWRETSDRDVPDSVKDQLDELMGDDEE